MSTTVFWNIAGNTAIWDYRSRINRFCLFWFCMMVWVDLRLDQFERYGVVFFFTMGECCKSTLRNAASLSSFTWRRITYYLVVKSLPYLFTNFCSSINPLPRNQIRTPWLNYNIAGSGPDPKLLPKGIFSSLIISLFTGSSWWRNAYAWSAAGTSSFEWATGSYTFSFPSRTTGSLLFHHVAFTIVSDMGQ